MMAIKKVAEGRKSGELRGSMMAIKKVAERRKSGKGGN